MPTESLEKREPLKWVVDKITSIGGLNRYNQPNFRVIWGANRLYKVGGKFKKVIEIETGILDERKRSVVVDVEGVREVYAYNPFRWHLEKWFPPEFYGGHDEWYEQIRIAIADGLPYTAEDYPEHGEYEHVFYLAECPHMKDGMTEWCPLCKATSGHYIPLEENFYLLEMQIHALQLSEHTTAGERKTALFKREQDRRQRNKQEVEDRVRNALRPHLAMQPTSFGSGMGGSKGADASMRHGPALLPRNRSGFGMSNHAMPTTKQEEIDHNGNKE